MKLASKPRGPIAYGAVVLALVGWGLPAVAGGTAYTYTLIADTTGAFRDINVESTHALNDSGEVAFWADPQSGSDHIFKGSGGPLTNVSAHPGVHDVSESGDVAINNSGTVVFRGAPESTYEAIFTGIGGDVETLISQRVFAEPRVFYHAVTINDSGAVAYMGGREGFDDQPANTMQSGFYLLEGGTITILAEEGSGYDATSFHPPAINDAGQVAFMMNPISDDDFHLLRYDGPGGGVTTLASGFSGTQPISINDNGDVSFIVGSTSVKTYRDGVVDTVADTTGGFQAFFNSGYGQTFINDVGQVAFFASLDSGGQGVFTGPDSIADRVVVTGQTLFGETVVGLKVEGFNNVGQVLFMANYESSVSREALIVATPVLVDEDADFDGDADIDGNDFLIWQRGVGGASGTGNAQGNADGDADIDGGDLAIWKTKFGGTISTVNAQAIPEPAPLALVGIALGTAACFAGARHRRSSGVV